MISLLGFILALTTAVFFAAFGLLGRMLAMKTENPRALAVINGMWALFLIIPIFLLEGGEFSGISPKVIFITFLATLFFGIFETAQFFYRKHLEASRSTVIMQIVPVVTFVGSVFFLSETVTWQKIGAIILILAGNIIAIFRHSRHVNKEGLFWVLLSAISLGLAYIADKAAFVHYPLGIYIFISYFFPALYVFLTMGKSGPSALKREFLASSWRIPLLALFSAGGYYSLLKTFQIAEASVAVPITFSSTVLTSIGGMVILKERSNIVPKLIGVLFVFFGLMLLR